MSMYEARQNKEKVSRRIDAAGNGMTKQKKTIGIMQCLRSKVPDYEKKIHYQTILYAELDGIPVGENGIFMSTGSDAHAEVNLIQTLNKLGKNSGHLIIYLSSSPCSSTYCTRRGEGEGCQEKLEELKERGFQIEIHADHLYQPQELRQVESKNGFPSGFCSASSAMQSSVPIDFSRVPKFFMGYLEHSNTSVAQFSRIGRYSVPTDCKSVGTEYKDL